MAATVNSRILVISDTHDLDVANFKERSFQAPLPFPKVEVLLHCGDLTEYGGLENYKKAIHLMASIDAELRLFIAGNHDVSLDPAFHGMQREKADTLPPAYETHEEALSVCTEYAAGLGVTYLKEGTHTFALTNGASFTVYASPYSTRHGEWAFQYPTNEDRYNLSPNDDPTVISTSTPTSIIPAGVDVVMTHGPPRYMFDSFGSGGHAGCEYLLKAISRTRPLLHCFGHIHPGWGARAVEWRKPVANSNSKAAGKRKRTDDPNSDSNNKAKAALADEEWLKDEQAPVFVGKNQTRKKGYAVLDTTTAGYERGEATWMVNAAIQDSDGEHFHVPWLVELALPMGSN